MFGVDEKRVREWQREGNEIDEITNKFQVLLDHCITEHDRLEAVCLNLWVSKLRTFPIYRQHYDSRDTREQPLHE